MASAWHNVRWFFAYWISRCGIAVGRKIPPRILYKISDPFSLLAYALLSKQRRNLTRNLATVVGEAQAPAVARRVFKNFGRYIIDFYQLPSLGSPALWRRVDFHDWKRLDEALDAERGTIFVTLHLGQAEFGAAALGSYGRQVSVIAQTFAYAPMNRFLQNLRRRLGMTIIPARSSKPDVLRCLHRGEILGLMFDAVEAAKGVEVEFLGRRAELSAAPARIALRTGARVLPAVVSRQGPDQTRFLTEVDFDLQFTPSGDEATDVNALTQAIARSFEPMVRRYADQWFAFSPVFAEHTEPEPSTAGWMTAALELAAQFGGYVPAKIAYGLAGFAGDLAYRLRSKTRADVMDNMRHVLGSGAPDQAVSRAARNVFRSVTRYYVDLIRLPHTSAADINGGQVAIHNLERLTGPTSQGRGVVVVGPHLGSPEMGAQAGSLLGLNVMVLIEPLRPPSLARTMAKLRSAHGTRYETVSVGAVARALRHLRSGGVVGITCDRDIQGTGSILDFFGSPTRLPTGAVELAARTGAVLLPAYSLRKAGRIDLYFEEPIELVGNGREKADILRNARALLATVEGLIRRDPGQWIVLERIWDPAKLRTGPTDQEQPQDPGGGEPEVAATTLPSANGNEPAPVGADRR